MSFVRIMAFLTLVHLGAGSLFSAEHPMYQSAHYLGRGNTGIAEADNQEAIFYNPAGLAQGEGIYKRFIFAAPQIELSSRTKTIYNRLEVEEKGQAETLKDEVGKPLHLGVSNLSALVFRRAALGAYADSDISAIVRKHPDFGGLETVDAEFVSNRVLTFSIAEAFVGDHLLLGVTGKFIHRTTSDLEANIVDAEEIKSMRDGDALRVGTGRGLDFGFMWKSGKNTFLTEHSLGLTLNNAGGSSFHAVDHRRAPDNLKQTLNFGYAYSMGTQYSRLKLLADYRDMTGVNETNPLKRIHLGSEINFANFIGVMGGFNQGYPTAGLFLNTYLVRVDLGVVTHEAGDRVGTYPDQRYYLRIMAGI